MSSRKFRLNKLIRDKVLDSMLEMKQDVKYHSLSDDEIVKALTAKLTEETKEFDPSEPNALKELADILEVVEALCLQLGNNFDDLRKLQATRREERGGFDERIHVDTVTVPEGDKWAEYYASDPDRFPEVK